jgi:adenosine deaminase
MPLTVCPLSNVKLCVFKRLQDHNLRRMLELGLCATVNSDDPAYFGGYVNRNYTECADALALTREELATLARNSFEASFASPEQKRRYEDRLGEYLAA